MAPPLRCLANITDDAPQWLWPGRIPLGALTLLVGDPAQGKSLLALDVAARVTTGASWPDVYYPTAPGDVLILASDDSPAGPLRRRLLALGADLARVHCLHTGEWSHAARPTPVDPILANGPVLKSTPFGYQPALVANRLTRDAFHLTEALDALPNCRLVIIDPLPTYLAAVFREAQTTMRELLAPLAILAERSGAALLATSHPDPALTTVTLEDRTPMNALGAMARAIYLVQRHPEDNRRRTVLTVKNNFADASTALSFEIQDAPRGGPLVVWADAPINQVPDDLPSLAHLPVTRRPRTQLDRAVAWLEGALAAGPVFAKDLETRAAKAGVSMMTLSRARARLAVKSFRQEARLGGRWLCALRDFAGPPTDQVCQPKDVTDMTDMTELLDVDAILANAQKHSVAPNDPPQQSAA